MYVVKKFCSLNKTHFTVPIFNQFSSKGFTYLTRRNAYTQLNPLVIMLHEQLPYVYIIKYKFICTSTMFIYDVLLELCY